MFRDPVVHTSESAASRRPSVRVVEAVADAAGVDALELDANLYEYVDPEALDKLFGPDGAGPTDGRITVPFGAYSVVVESDGEDDVSVFVYVSDSASADDGLRTSPPSPPTAVSD